MSHQHHQLELSNVGFSYGSKKALQDVRFSSHCGQRLALLGPNGAGKSTLIRLLASLLKLQEGNILWRGAPLAQARREVAYLPQVDQHQKNFPLRVRDIIEMGRFPHLGHFKRFRKIDQEKCEAALATMQLEDIADRQIDQLSGGQQQRTYIARALAQEAHVLLLDEPFNGLDIESRCHLAANLIELSNSGHLIIASHHQLESVTDIFTHALVLDQKQVCFGEATSVMESPEVKETLHACHPLHSHPVTDPTKTNCCS
ncbi:ABC transporter ATP-binding protein [Akkermansiaceae bacterium]|jgi:ABC-type Mn2+/Zn2+ transport system ATPase subunit|nr:ABC transporter ATP-binding protein [Akkermansiaceae bacterium]|tara:strand:- start:1985 stop:2758 length:774 start_codon:yes stop_codon:yes gene_type:complete